MPVRFFGELPMSTNESLQSQYIKQYLDVHLHRDLNLSLQSQHIDKLTTRVIMSDQLIGNPYTHIIHGGYLAAALDASAGLCASLSVFNKQSELTLETMTALITDISTTNLQVNYLRPGTGQYFDIESETLRSGRRLTVVESRCRDDQNRLIATCSAQFVTG